MRQVDTLRNEMLIRVNDFGAAHSAMFADSTLAGQMFAEVSAAVLQLGQQSATEVTGRSAAREGVNTKADARTALRKQLETINRTACALAIDRPNVDDKFQLPSGRTDHALLSTARSFAENAAPLADAFITHAMPETFLTELNTGIARFEQATHDHQAGKGTKTAARARFRAALEAGLTAVRRLDAIVANRLRDDPVTMAVWEQARHVEQMPRTHGETAPATTPTATPTAATGAST
jgi:hypothetical protein